MKKLISIVLPAYNESYNVKVVYEHLKKEFTALDYHLQILFIDDGSSDDTIDHIRELAAADKEVDYIQFSRNFGHQAAVMAGYNHAKGDAVISMDCDMQHPPHLLPSLICKWEEGYEVVYTRRAEDKKLGFFKRKSSSMFYKALNSVSDTKIEPGTADFRLVDRKVVNVLNSMHETDPFIRGLIKWVGFRQYAIDYMPNERYSGESKYNMSKMIRLAVHGVTSFSVRPLYIAIWIGAMMSIFSILYLPYVIYSHSIGSATAGWSSLILTIVLLGGIQLLVIGFLGLYLGRIFVQSKQRPNYIITDTTIR